MGNNEDRGEIFDLDKNSKVQCMLCECVPNAHACFWSCPIFKDLPICSTCCTVDALRTNIEKVFSEKLGKKITREELNEMCRKCGRNHAVNDDEVADRLVFNSFDGVTEEKEDDKEQEEKDNNDRQ